MNRVRKPARYPQRVPMRGYRYQDLVAASVVARAIVEGGISISFELARFADDRFDDIVYKHSQGTTRIQCKHSDSRIELSEDRFTGSDSRLKIEDLVQGYVFDPDPNCQLRIFASWSRPANVSRFLSAATTPPLHASCGSSVWRLDTAEIWPVGGKPRWPALMAFGRDVFAQFADQFVLELETPSMSAELNAPGPMERLLLALLTDDIGVERPPNDRDAYDVAARLIDLASSARSRPDNDRTRTLDVLMHDISLIADRGRVTQTSPLIEKQYVRSATARLLERNIGKCKRLVLTGAPGTGKSWALEGFAKQLRRSGYVVARHYCFLEPGDPDVQRRASMEAMCGNLITELLSDTRLNDLRLGLAGDIDALAQAVQTAHDALYNKGPHTSALRATRQQVPSTQPPPPGIVLIVDGLDHISRIDRAGLPSLQPEDVATSLATISLPDNVTLVVGSQPGTFLQVLLGPDTVTLETSPFSEREMALQIRQLGTFDELQTAGLSRHNRAVVHAFMERAAGSPLYARFISRTLSPWLAQPTAENPEDVVRRLPAAPGDLAIYYRYLLTGAEGAPDAGLLAEHLALLDFAVTLDELTKILPAMGRRRLSGGLQHLRPILIEQTGGLFRIYHESLRRYVMDTLRQEGRSISALLHPVIDWLKAEGLFNDSRAYRFLLPLYRRASRESELLDSIQCDFVAQSVIALQPFKALHDNLSMAAQVAAEAGNFQVLCALAELTFSAGIAYEEKLADLDLYASAAIELYGSSYVADRLLFDGKPLFDRNQGLRLCSLIDDAGGIAPWGPFMRLEKLRQDGDQDIRDRIAPFHGFCKLTAEATVFDRVYDWLTSTTEIDDDYAMAVARRFVKMFDLPKVAQFVTRLTTAIPSHSKWFALALATEFAARGDQANASLWATHALHNNIPAPYASMLLRCGIAHDRIRVKMPSLESLVSDLLAKDDTSHDLVEPYIALVEINADQKEKLQSVRKSLTGEGWYRQWLRFVIDATLAGGDDKLMVSALSLLAERVGPFSGTPRAIDMYSIRSIVMLTIRRALDILTPASRLQILDSLIAIVNGTTAYLQGAPAGPFRFLELAECLLSFPEIPLVEKFENYIATQWNNEYYELHAEICLQLARLWRRAGNSTKAQEYWLRSGRYLTAYGFHKDVTILHLIDGCTVLLDTREVEVIDKLKRLQWLVERALAHSDGKETRHAPAAWFEALVRASPVTAAHLLAISTLADERVPDRVFDNALQVLLTRSGQRFSPEVYALLYSACPAREDAQARLESIARLATSNMPLASDLFAVACVSIDGDQEMGKMTTDSRQLMLEFASRCGFSQPEFPESPSPVSGGTIEREAKREPVRRGPFFSATPTPIELLKVLKSVRLDDFESPADPIAFASELTVHLETLRTSGGAAIILGLCADFARRSYTSRCIALEKVAEKFEEKDRELAAEIYVLAWCGSMTSWGRFGGLRQRDLLERGLRANRERALRRLAVEVAEEISRGRPFGLSLRVVEALCIAADIDDACAAWDAACKITEFRLPKTGPEHGHFSPLQETIIEPDAASGELLGALLTHPEYERRGLALGVFARVSEVRPDVAFATMRFLMSRDSTNDDLVVILELARTLPGLKNLPSDVQDTLRAFACGKSFKLSYAAKRLLGSGVEADGNSPRLPSMISLGSPWRASELERIDYGGRIREISYYDAKFSRMVAGVYANYGQQRIRAVRERQRDWQTSRSAPWAPRLRMHTWDKELLDAAIDESVPSLAASLSERGQWGPEIERRIVECLIPDAACSASRAYSRDVRPDVPLPRERSSGVGPLCIHTLGAYRGWLQYGFWERQFGEDRIGENEGFVSLIKVGAFCGKGDEDTIYRSELAFGRWHAQLPGDMAKFTDGPVVQEWAQDDAAFSGMMLTLCAELRGLLRIRPAMPTSRLDFVNEKGDTVVIYRCWRYHPYSIDYGPATPQIEGGVLLVHPEASGRVTQAIGELQARSLVEHRSVGERRAPYAFPPPILSEQTCPSGTNA